MKKEKARSTICWECGKKLWNPALYEELLVDGHKRILHRLCAANIKRGKREEQDDEE